MKIDTLHICNYDVSTIDTLDFYINLVSENDSVVFFVQNIDDVFIDFYKTLPFSINIFIISDDKNKQLKTINYEDFVDLMIDSNKTFTWS